MSSQIKELDRALAGDTLATSDEIDALVALGRQVNEAYATFTPSHTPQRAMFVRAVTDKDGAGWSRFVAPATVTSSFWSSMSAKGMVPSPMARRSPDSCSRSRRICT